MFSLDNSGTRSDFLHEISDRVGLNWVFRQILASNLRVVMYHGITDDNDETECWWLIRQSRFEKQIDYLHRHFHIISLDDAHGYVTCNERLPNRLCVLTFDDGYKSYLTRALPVLKSRGIPSTVYIPAGLCPTQDLIWTDRVFASLNKCTRTSIDLRDIELGFWPMTTGKERMASTHQIIDLLKRVPLSEREDVIGVILDRAEVSSKEFFSPIKENSFALLSVEDIRCLSSEPLVTIGSHSLSHEILPNLSLEEARQEISESKRMLEVWTQGPIEHFAYPDGKYIPAIARLVESARYKTAARIGLGLFRRNRLFEMPRLGTGSWDSDYTFRAMINGYFSVKVEVLRWLRSTFSERIPTGGDH